MFSKFKDQVHSAIDNASEKITKKEIGEEDLSKVLEDLKISLVQSDVAFETAEHICEDIRNDLQGKKVKRTEVEDVIEQNFQNSIRDLISQEEIDLVEKIKAEEKPSVVLFLGFNGSGKSTTLSKFAKLLLKEDLEIVFAAGDTYRAASIEQLDKHGENLGVKVIKHDYGADAAAVVYDAIEHARAEGMDAVLADTAGRSHSDANLMEELKKICRVNDPDWKILVLDSLTGNDAVDQAEKFKDAVGVGGVILTKMDVNEKGGAAISVADSIEKPILYIGVGQGYGDLEKFKPSDIADRILK